MGSVEQRGGEAAGELEHARRTDLVEADAAAVAELLEESRSESTRRAYASAWRTFGAWARGRGYPSKPAPAPVIASYVADRARAGVTYSTICRDLAAIRAVHQDAGLEDPTRHHGIRVAVKAVARRAGTAPRRQAAPLTADLARQILAAMPDRDRPSGIRDAALILLALAGALRRSEVAALTIGDVEWRADGIVLHVRRSKTDQTGAGDVIGIPYGASESTCPVRALQAWIAVARRAGQSAMPLFSRFHHTAGERPVIGAGALSDRSVARIIQKRARAAGLSVTPGNGRTWISGHSPRAGHATTAASMGADAVTIARTTRHKRIDTLAKYIRPSQVLDDSTAGKLGL